MTAPRRTPAQTAVLAQYRMERNLGLDDYAAARMVRGAFAADIAALAVRGVLPSAQEADRFRVADQWFETVRARSGHPLLRLVHTLADANRQAAS